MKASILDLRQRTREIIRALDRNETVTIFYRGKKKGVIHPAGPEGKKDLQVLDHPAFGLWKDRADLSDVDAAVRGLRKSRHAV